MGRPWGNHRGAGPGANSWLRVSPPARAAHPAPRRWGCEGELGIFANTASRKSQPPGYLVIPSRPLGKQKRRRGCVGKTSTRPAPHQPRLSETCLAPTRSPGGTPRDPAAPSLGRSGCHCRCCHPDQAPGPQGQAGERSWDKQGHHRVHPRSPWEVTPPGNQLTGPQQPNLAIHVSKMPLPKAAEAV